MFTKRFLPLLVMAVGPAAILLAQASTTPEQAAQSKVQRYAATLLLSSSQQEQALTIFTNEGTAEAPIRKAEGLAHDVLNAAVKANNTTNITETSVLLGQLSGQATTAKSLAEAQFWALLTSDQQAKYTQMQSQMSSSGFGGGLRGGRGGPPPQ